MLVGRYQKLVLEIKKQGPSANDTVNQNILDHYSQKIEELKTRIKVEEEKQNGRNVGKVFVVFKSRQLSYRYRQQVYMQDRLKRAQLMY